jgi:predicted ribonuclease YlaK
MTTQTGTNHLLRLVSSAGPDLLSFPKQVMAGKTSSSQSKKRPDVTTQSRTNMKKSNSSHLVTRDELEPIQPITGNQKLAFDYWDQGYNLMLSGSAGTGKTFMALYFAFKEMLENDGIYDKVMIMRSVVPTRDVGFLQGSLDEKKDPFSKPYKLICDEIFGYEGAYNKLVMKKKLEFEITSHIRGCTYDNMIIIVDEMQNCNFHELDSIITRVGKDCKVIFSGDVRQSDFKYKDEKEGIEKFALIIEQMRFFRIVEFEWADIVRSDFVRDYIMTKEMMGL